LNEASNIELAGAFLREALCDLGVVDVLVKAVKPGSGDPVEQGLAVDELFCIGRRALFMLQQVAEEPAGAFILVYPKPVLETMREMVE
jgi:hypothetical protein